MVHSKDFLYVVWVVKAKSIILLLLRLVACPSKRHHSNKLTDFESFNPLIIFHDCFHSRYSTDNVWDLDLLLRWYFLTSFYLYDYMIYLWLALLFFTGGNWKVYINTVSQIRLTQKFRTGLIITELKLEAKKKTKPIIIALTDAQKAFDIVWHAGLMREMNKIGMSDDNWLLFQQWYTNLSSKIKWQGMMSRTITEKQGAARWSLVSNGIQGVCKLITKSIWKP